MQQDQHASTPPPPAGARGGRKPKRKSSFGKLTPGQAACARWAMGAPADDLGRDDSHDTPCEETECSQADGCSSHSRQSSSLKLFSPGGVRSRSGNRSVARRPQEPLQRATGNRIISLDMIHAQLCPVMQCPVCRKLGTLVIGLEEEEARGLAGILKFVCSNCEEVTEVQLHTSPMATAVRNTVKAGKNEGKNAGGRFQSELNLRAALAAAMCGFGELGLQKLCGVLNMPALMVQARKSIQCARRMRHNVRRIDS
ncbi:hypothetical protein AB1Y20_003322 [Prymnesium parvum]|uniref:Mutator-like transposase domain-containing protein n=1 Tax=Prymnesium parvum TaxID=97485 RepID=A0AB34JEG9_PRYPA